MADTDQISNNLTFLYFIQKMFLTCSLCTSECLKTKLKWANRDDLRLHSTNKICSVKTCGTCVKLFLQMFLQL